MKRIHHHIIFRKYAIYMVCLGILLGGCKKYLDMPLPLDVIAGEAAFTTDKSCAAVINNVYSSLAGGSGGINNIFDGKGIGYYTGIYSDELQSIGLPTATERIYYQNAVQAANTGGTWASIYKLMYSINLAIEGVSSASEATVRYKSQWLGEAYFMRALLHFYLVNLFGDCVLATTSDYRVNNTASRSKVQDVYAQIIKDLLQAQSLLSDSYKGGNGQETVDRGRPNKAAATALLARVYLYNKDWTNAEIQASAVIGNSLYQLPALAEVFLKGSKETICAFAPVAGSFARDYEAYNNGMAATVPAFPANGVQVAMSNDLVSTFEPGDNRFTSWTRLATSITDTTIRYRFPDKYKTRINDVEYIVVLRLAEQYLIRAEARAQLGRVVGAGSAQSDLDAIRTRAGLPGTTASSSAEMQNAIAKERRTELFAENGHRMFDLRRTEKLNDLMVVLTPMKGGTSWQPYMQWWPIPVDDIFANPNLVQTAGYQ
ncbi:RagB/SusD family nutrient uptake outer membrane protein [Chitinophaga sp. S165]|uniref:RagB/SusD family nutrient uptake outer membrane protein n=1 Tax=Chitinophaga sp. S165 TaxID=2135462 RepID=UPI000D89DCE6|nr:RagB/SusD family nutrient uptake outer membrane protein [Chitinophaga sp. S165]PWV45402.1 SusD-like starch-binding protein associating with outer membrane [Chitinophaga sp. S165]